MAKDPQQSQAGDILASDFDWFGNATGGTAYAVSMDGVGTSYNEGRIVAFRTGSASVGTATLSINSIGAKSIKLWGPTGLANPEAGHIQAGQIVAVVYDATNDCFVMINAPQKGGVMNGYSTFSVSLSTGTAAGTMVCLANERILAMFSGNITAAGNVSQTPSAAITCDGGGMAATCNVNINSGSSNAGMTYGASMSGYTVPLTAGTRTVTLTFTPGSSGGSISGQVFLIKISA